MTDLVVGTWHTRRRRLVGGGDREVLEAHPVS
jgi:hypothetical protein